MGNYFRIIMIICLISSLARFVLDSYLPSLPAIALAHDMSDKLVESTLTLYLLGFSLSQLIYGPISDRYGRKIVIIFGLSVFAFGNFLCAVSHSQEILLCGRIIAGIGAGACGVLNRAIASDCFKGPEFAKAWSYTTSALVLTLCIAPVIGGYIEEISGWRGNFILSTLFVSAVLLILWKYLPETNLATQKQLSALSLHKVLNNYITILKTPAFINGSLCYSLAFAGLIAYFQVSPIIFINHMGLSPSAYGWSALIIAVNYLLGGLIVNRLSSHFSQNYLLMTGSILLIIGGFAMGILAQMGHSTVLSVLIPAAFYVIGARIIIPNAIAGSMESLRHLNGSTSAMLGFIQMLVSTLISLSIAQIDNVNSFPLSVFLVLLGLATVTVVFKMIGITKGLSEQNPAKSISSGVLSV